MILMRAISEPRYEGGSPVGAQHAVAAEAHLDLLVAGRALDVDVRHARLLRLRSSN